MTSTYGRLSPELRWISKEERKARLPSDHLFKHVMIFTLPLLIVVLALLSLVVVITTAEKRNKSSKTEGNLSTETPFPDMISLINATVLNDSSNEASTSAIDPGTMTTVQLTKANTRTATDSPSMNRASGTISTNTIVARRFHERGAYENGSGHDARSTEAPSGAIDDTENVVWLTQPTVEDQYATTLDIKISNDVDDTNVPEREDEISTKEHREGVPLPEEYDERKYYYDGPHDD